MLPDIYWIQELGPLQLAMMPRPRSGDWLEDEISGWCQSGIGIVVSLLEAQEISQLGLANEQSLCTKHGVRFISFPIQDRSVPASVVELKSLVKLLADELRSGTGVGIHCRAGIGRSGLVAGCVLLELGVPFDKVFSSLSQARGMTVPDTIEQAAWVETSFLSLG